MVSRVPQHVFVALIGSCSAKKEQDLGPFLKHH